VTKSPKSNGLPTGVFPGKLSGTYRVIASRNGTKEYIGYYHSIEEASKAYEEFRLANPKWKPGPKTSHSPAYIRNINESLKSTPWNGL